MVEMPGIEPGSDGASRSILRVQFAHRCFQLQRSREQGADELSCVGVGRAPATNARPSGFLNDTEVYAESMHRSADFAGRLGSEGEIGALVLGTY